MSPDDGSVRPRGRFDKIPQFRGHNPADSPAGFLVEVFGSRRSYDEPRIRSLCWGARGGSFAPAADRASGPTKGALRGMDFQLLLKQAVLLHQIGKLAEAERLYEQVLSANRRDFPAQHQLALLLFQSRRLEQSRPRPV